MKIAVLGAGKVGSAIAKDLAQEAAFSVTVIDFDQRALDRLKAEARLSCLQSDLRKRENISQLVSEVDIVVCAVPGFMGFETLKQIIEAGKDVVDISFFAEDPFLLDELAKSKGVTVVVDCGVAPGLCNILAGYVFDQFDQTDRYACYVGGLPQLRLKPFEYKVVFSLPDVLEEYTRPARLVENGREVVRPALSEVELMDFPGVGTLEAFNADGLRSMRNTLNIPFMVEKTLRYPGHAGLMRIFRESRFFDTSPIEVEGQMVSPLALTAKLLSDQWRLAEGETDFTVMEVVLEGQKNGKRLRHSYYLLDSFDSETQTTSMARTTGYTCSIVVRQLLRKLFTQKGICPPEFLGRTKGCYEDLLAGYEKRNIRIKETILEL